MSNDLENIAHAADNLKAETAANDPAAQAGQPAPGTTPDAPADQPQVSNKQAVAMALTTGREFLVTILGVQSAKLTLADDKVLLCAEAIAPVLDKYGIQLGRLKGGVEISAIMTAGPILWAAYAAAMAEIAVKKAQAQAQAGQASGGEVVGSATVVETHG